MSKYKIFPNIKLQEMISRPGNVIYGHEVHGILLKGDIYITDQLCMKTYLSSCCGFFCSSFSSKSGNFLIGVLFPFYFLFCVLAGCNGWFWYAFCCECHSNFFTIFDWMKYSVYERRMLRASPEDQARYVKPKISQPNSRFQL